MRVREALRGKVMVLLDDRDRHAIGEDIDEDPPEARRVEVGRHVSSVTAEIVHSRLCCW